LISRDQPARRVRSQLHRLLRSLGASIHFYRCSTAIAVEAATSARTKHVEPMSLTSSCCPVPAGRFLSMSSMSKAKLAQPVLWAERNPVVRSTKLRGHAIAIVGDAAKPHWFTPRAIAPDRSSRSTPPLLSRPVPC